MSLSLAQPAILDPLPPLGRFLVFDLSFGVDPRPALARWREEVSPERTVVGVGVPLVAAAQASLPDLRVFPGICGRGVSFPSTQGALWTFLGGSDASDLNDRAWAIQRILGDGFFLREDVASFLYRKGRDLTGFKDGTENPQGANAVAAAIRSGDQAGIAGSSFVAVQRWVHDLLSFARKTADERDRTIGRRKDTNEELQDAPASAHVKRTAQESFEPPAFMLRRSMPWGGLDCSGLYFVAYGESLDRFERVLRRMAGEEDGVVDALLSFSRAETGGYYWCPPVEGGRIDWTAVGV
jgi:putative iron-dependent peroxidase